MGGDKLLKAALNAYWWFLQGALYRALATVAKLSSPELLVRYAIAEFRKAIADKLFAEFLGIAYGERPRTLEEYLTVTAKAHDAIASLGIRISLIRAEKTGQGVRVEVRDAVPGMEVVPEEDRPYAMLISIGILLGIVEAVTGRTVGLRVPQLGIDLVGDGAVMEVEELDIAGNRYVALVKE